MSDNKLQCLPNDMGKAVALRVLSLSSNRFHSIPPQLKLIRNLEQVDLLDNALARADHQEAAKSQASLLAHLRTLPDFGCFGLGELMSHQDTANLRVRVQAREGEFERRLHREIAMREPRFRRWDEEADVFGDGVTAIAALDAVLLFLYSGILVCEKALFAEVERFVSETRLEVLLHLVEKQSASEDERVVIDDSSSMVRKHRGEGVLGLLT